MGDRDQVDAAAADDALEAEWSAMEAAARSRLLTSVDLERGSDSPPAGIVAAAAGARELVQHEAWPLDWVARAAGEPPDGDAALLLALLEAVVAPTHPTGLGDDEAVLLTLEPDDWVDVAVALSRQGAGAPADPAALAGLVGGAPDGLLEAAFELVVPVWQACGAVDLDERLTRVGAWLVPRAVEAALRE